MLNSLEEELAALDAQIEVEMQDGSDEEMLHRAARWKIYRMFVAAAYGFLGKGSRVRISHCVISAIRYRFPQPMCNCAPKDIATCTLHGYVGHRDA